MDVDFYFSIGSRYSYLASSQLAALAEETGARFHWRPVNNPELLARLPASPFEGEPRSIQYRAEWRDRDVRRWASLYGVEYREPGGRLELDSDLLARAATAGAVVGEAARVGRLLFRAVFAEAREGLGRAELLDAVAAAGLDAERFGLVLDAPETAATLDRAIDDAIAAGVQGVPTFLLGPPGAREHFWGNDRLPLLRHRLLSGAVEPAGPG